VTNQTQTFDPAASGWSYEPEDGFIGLVGPIWRKHEDGRQHFGFMAEAKHANLVGIVQGGMLMTFADRSLGMLAWDAAGGSVVTVTFDYAFLDAGRLGSFIELDGEVVRRTSSLVFLRGTLRDRARIIGTCQGTWKILARGARKAAQPEQRP
jgi:acyl-coenzyme A thioesterase PaaI-like protein